MTNFVAFSSMSVNIIFYLWAKEVIQTSQIESLISFFMILFPETSSDKELNQEPSENERDLDYDSAVDGERIKAQAQARFINKQKQFDDEATLNSSGRPTEDTRLTSGSGSYRNSNPFYYTADCQFDPDEEQKSFNNSTMYSLSSRRNGPDASTNFSRDMSAHFILDDSAIDFIIKDEAPSGSESTTSQFKGRSSESAAAFIDNNKYEDAQNVLTTEATDSVDVDKKLLDDGRKTDSSLFDNPTDATKAESLNQSNQQE